MQRKTAIQVSTNYAKLGVKILTREYETLKYYPRVDKNVNKVMFEPLFWWDTIYKPQKYRKLLDSTNKTLV